MADLNQQARSIIENNIYCTIATASLDGTPWITPVFFNYDPHRFSLYWVSATSTVHSQLIAKNPRVAISVYDSHAPFGAAQGVYITGKASAVAEKDLRRSLDIFYGGRYPDKETRSKVSENNFIGASQHRMFHMIPEQSWILQNPKAPGGNIVDFRAPVTL